VAVPAEGGGHIFFDTSRALAFTGTPMLGGPNGDRLVVSGALGTAPVAQVLKAELGRELLIRPRADLGGTVNLELPVAAGELGMVLLAAAPLPLPVSVGALAGGFQLDPTSVVTVLAGTGTGQGPLQAQLGIPNVPFLSRRAVYLQGVRVTSPMPTGDFTRLVRSGMVLLAAAPLPLPVSVGALAGGFQLDPTSVVTVLAGTGTGQGPLQAQLGIPNVPFLSRRAVYLQGVRVTSPMPTGDFTRLV